MPICRLRRHPRFRPPSHPPPASWKAGPPQHAARRRRIHAVPQLVPRSQDLMLHTSRLRRGARSELRRRLRAQRTPSLSNVVRGPPSQLLRRAQGVRKGAYCARRRGGDLQSLLPRPECGACRRTPTCASSYLRAPTWSARVCATPTQCITTRWSATPVYRLIGMGQRTSTTSSSAAPHGQ